MVENIVRQSPELPIPQIPQTFPPETRLSYDTEGDILSVYFGSPRPATSLDLGGELWVRMDPLTGEVCGIEIEDFAAVYLKKHPDSHVIWSEMGSQKQRQLPVEDRRPFVEGILTLCRSLLLQQSRLSQVGS
ncbi:MAG: DUF2283 domain-containing protein [Dehalococcoidia bacterium]